MIKETDVILKSSNKFEVGIIEEDGMWYLVKDRS